MARSFLVFLFVMAMSGVLLSEPLPVSSAGQPEPVLPTGESALAISSGFIRAGLPLHGTVVQPGTTRSLYGAGDLLFIRLAPGEAAVPGDLFTLYKNLHRVFHPAHGKYLGDLIAILGLVRVTRVDDTLATAQVLQSFSTISAGDGAMRFVPLKEEPRLPGRPLVDRSGMIVDIQAPRTLIGQRNVVYVDWGRHDGLQVGDRLEVLRSQPGLPPKKIGELQVLSLEDSTATSLVARSTDTLNRGDRVVFLESASVPAPKESEGPKPIEEARVTPPPVPQPSTQVEIKQVGDQLQSTLEGLVGQLQYESGQFTVKPEGLAILNQVSELLKAVTDKHIRIEGHTDNVEIGPKLKPLFPTNQELSQARATHVLRYLTEVGDLDRANVSAIGYADTKPVAGNETEEGRTKNRRIEIVLVPKEAGAPQPESLPEPVPSPAAPESQPAEPALPMNPGAEPSQPERPPTPAP